MKRLSSLGRAEEDARRAAKGWRWAGEHTYYLIQLTPHDRNKGAAAVLLIQQHITSDIALYQSLACHKSCLCLMQPGVYSTDFMNI